MVKSQFLRFARRLTQEPAFIPTNLEMDEALAFLLSAAPHHRLSRPMVFSSHEHHVRIYALRRAAGEEIFHPLDTDNDPEEIHHG